MDFIRALPMEVVCLIIEAMVDVVGLRNSMKLRLVNRMCLPGFYMQTSNEIRFVFVSSQPYPDCESRFCASRRPASKSLASSSQGVQNEEGKSSPFDRDANQLVSCKAVRS